MNAETFAKFSGAAASQKLPQSSELPVADLLESETNLLAGSKDQALQLQLQPVPVPDDQFLWLNPHLPDRDRDKVFFRIVAGDMRSHTFIGKQPTGFDCMCQCFNSFRPTIESVYVLPCGAPFGCKLNLLSLDELLSVQVWHLGQGIGYVPKADQNLKLV